jgi:lipoprotein signal peptidase
MSLSFLKKYAWWLVLLVLFLILLTLFLMILTSEPQEGGFVYLVS